jgi:parallel beta-helix repeat protein
MGRLYVFVSLAIALVALAQSASRALATTAGLNAVADAYVYSAQPSANFGTLAVLRADASPIMRAFLRFNVAGSTGAQRILLRVYAETGNGLGLDVRTITDNGWTESGITYDNQPALGAVVASSGPVTAGSWIEFDVTKAVAGDGPVAFALTTESSTAIRLSSRESANPPQLVIEQSAVASFLVTRSGDTYTAQSPSGGTVFTGTLKQAVERAVANLQARGGGEIVFAAGTFDFGADYFRFSGVNDVTFTGAGMGRTILRNDSSEAADTEPFNFEGSDRITIRDLTVSAGGAVRPTSDALDFDGGDDVVIERVEVTQSRGRGIVFDGKDAPHVTGGTALRNVVRNCVITGGVARSGIELLAAGENRVEGCTISDVGGHGIHVHKAAPTAAQPNKPSTDNVVTGNTITNAGIDGINITSSHRNRILNNMIRNSSDKATGRAGIWIASSEALGCDSNVVEGNTATDDQPVKTQRYGLAIGNAECFGNVVGDNSFAGNAVASILDQGNATVYRDTSGPSAPTNLQASTSAGVVSLTWNASVDNYAVDGYRIRRNGVQIGSVGAQTLTFSDTSVAPATTYTYTVAAFDKARNESAAATVTVTTVATGTMLIGAAADAYVYSEQPSVNFGSIAALRTDASPVMRSFLRFNVAGRASARRVILRVYAETGNSLGLDLLSVADNTWTETGITYANQPALGARIASSGPITAGSWVSFDVTSLVARDGAVSFALTSASATAIRLTSREGSNAPQLALEGA